MPIYEYICEACGELTEAMQKFSDAPLVDCGRCGRAGALRKKISLSSFSLKGSGWYSTDYKKKAAPPESKDAARPESKDAAKPESKDAAKSVSKPSEGSAPSPAPKDPK